MGKRNTVTEKFRTTGTHKIVHFNNKQCVHSCNFCMCPKQGIIFM